MAAELKEKIPMVESKIRTPLSFYQEIEKIVRENKVSKRGPDSINAFYNKAALFEVKRVQRSRSKAAPVKTT